MPFPTFHEELFIMELLYVLVLLLYTSIVVESLRREFSTFHDVDRKHSHYRQHGREPKSHDSEENNSFIDLSGLISVIHSIIYSGVDSDQHVPMVLSRFDVVA